MTQAIFLSYASQDADAARRICEALRAAGLEVWFDQSELAGGDAWDQKIRKQIKECSLFVPIISANTNAREEGYFRREWNIAVDRMMDMADHKAFLFPLILDDLAEASAVVPERFRERQWTRLGTQTSDDAAMNAFADRIAKLFSGRASSSKNASTSPSNGEVVALATARKGVAPTQVGAQVSSSAHPQPNLDPGLPLRSLRDDNLKSGAHRDQVASPAEKTPSIAVLAFANRSASADDEYFSDGLADELLNVLATIKGLRVSARASSFQFKGKSTSPSEIGRALNVRHLLDGSVRKSGNRARIAVQLVDTATGDQHWAESFDRTLDDVFAVQDEIAQAVATALRVQLLPAAIGSDIASLGRTANSDAHRERMQGKALFQRSGHRDRHAAIAYFERAVALDPEYAGAWADLSFALYWRGASGGDGQVLGIHDYTPDFLAARDAANRANALEPNLPEALMAQAALVRILDWDQTEAIRLMRRAVLLAPNDALILLYAADVLAENRCFDEAAAHAAHAIELDPISLHAYATLAGVEAARGDVEKAEALNLRALAFVASDLFFPRFALFTLRLQQGRLHECEAMPPEWSIPSHRTIPASMLAWVRGEVAHSNEQLAVVKRQASVLACYQIAQVHAYRQEAVEALAWIEKCIEVRDPGVFSVNTDSLFDFLRGDARLSALRGRLGFLA